MWLISVTRRLQKIFRRKLQLQKFIKTKNLPLFWGEVFLTSFMRLTLDIYRTIMFKNLLRNEIEFHSYTFATFLSSLHFSSLDFDLNNFFFEKKLRFAEHLQQRILCARESEWKNLLWCLNFMLLIINIKDIKRSFWECHIYVHKLIDDDHLRWKMGLSYFFDSLELCFHNFLPNIECLFRGKRFRSDRLNALIIHKR